MENDMIIIMARMEQIITVVGIAYYLLQCFAGYRMIKISIGIMSFITGFSAAFMLAVPNFDTSSYAPAVIGLAAGVLLAFLGYKLYLAGVFILCGSLAAYAVNFIPFPQEGFYEILKVILVLLAFIVVGILGVRFAKGCIILVTAITGAINAVNLLKTPVPSLSENELIAIVLIAVLAIFGILIQRLSNK